MPSLRNTWRRWNALLYNSHQAGRGLLDVSEAGPARGRPLLAHSPRAGVPERAPSLCSLAPAASHPELAAVGGCAPRPRRAPSLSYSRSAYLQAADRLARAGVAAGGTGRRVTGPVRRFPRRSRRLVSRDPGRGQGPGPGGARHRRLRPLPGAPGLPGTLAAARVRRRRARRLGRAGRGGTAGGPPPVAGRDPRHRIPPGPARTVTERPADGSPPWPPRAPPRPPPWPRPPRAASARARRAWRCDPIPRP